MGPASRRSWGSRGNSDNSTPSGNDSAPDENAPYYGGGIFNAGPLSLSDSTLSHNIAPDGGGIYNDGGTVTVSNSK